MYVYEPLKFVESIAFPRFGGTSEERRAAEIIKAEAEKMGGCERIVAFGGGARSEIWCRILANTTAKTLCIPETEETGILGAARLASRMRS